MQHFASSRWYKYQPGQRYPGKLDVAARRGRPGTGCGLFSFGTKFLTTAKGTWIAAPAKHAVVQAGPKGISQPVNEAPIPIVANRPTVAALYR